MLKRVMRGNYNKLIPYIGKIFKRFGSTVGGLK